MSFALGMSWLHHGSRYQSLFGEAVPDWVCTLPMAGRVRLVQVALALRWRLAQPVLVRDEFHDGRWSVWGG